MYQCHYLSVMAILFIRKQTQRADFEHVLFAIFSDYTDLAMSTVTQTQAIPYTGPFNLLSFQLQKLTGVYLGGHGHALHCPAFKTTSSLQRSSEWRFLRILQLSLDYAASARCS